MVLIDGPLVSDEIIALDVDVRQTLLVRLLDAGSMFYANHSNHCVEIS